MDFQLFDMEGNGRLEEDAMDVSSAYPEIVADLTKKLKDWSDELVEQRWGTEGDKNLFLEMYSETAAKEYVLLNSNGDAPSPPLEINYENVSDKFHISWSKSPLANGYILERSEDSISWERITTTDHYTFSFSDVDPVEGQVYYRMKAYNAAGYSTLARAFELDREELRDAVTAAREKLDTAVVGTSAGQYTLEVLHMATQAISAAQDVLDNSGLQSEIDAALLAFLADMENFNARTVDKLDPSGLEAALAEARENVDTAIVGTGTGEYTQEVYELAINAIINAQNVLDTATIQSVVDAAIITLRTEMAKFLPNITGIPHPGHSVSGIHPNPVSDVLFINGDRPAGFVITDAGGRVLVHGNAGIGPIDVSSLQEGIYFIKIRTETDAIQTSRFIKLK
jgi:hypothetical protein